MRALAFKTYLHLLLIDLILRFRGFPALYDSVRRVRPAAAPSADRTTEDICRAVDLACIWYWKQVPCLQRSAVTTIVLRRHGIAAFLVLGAQPLPFRAHAWVEADGKVVNDKPYVSEIYPELDRC